MKVDFSQLPTSVSMTFQILTPLNGGSNILNSAVFYDEKNSYYIADIKNINIVNKVYTKYTGSIMSYYNGQSCLNYTHEDQDGILTLVDYQMEGISSQDFFKIGSQGDYYDTNPYNMYDFSVLTSYNNWCTTNTPLTYEFTNQMEFEYVLYSGPITFPYREFYTSPYCEDASFNNIPRLHYIQANSSAPKSVFLNTTLPSSITFDFTTNLITVDSSNQNDVMIYYIGIRSELHQQSNYIKDQMAQITIINPCLVATVTPSVLTTQIYYFRMQNGTQSITLPNFIYNNSICEKVHQLVNSTVGGTLNPLFDYDNSTNLYKLDIDTNQVTNGTVFNLAFQSYYLYSNHSQSMKTIDIQINIYNCLDAQLIPSLSNKTYYISDPTATIPLSIYDTNPNHVCGIYQYYPALLLSGSIPVETALPTYITFDPANLNLQVQTSNASLIGQYEIRVYGNATAYNILNYYDFMIEFKCKVTSLTTTPLAVQNYGIKQPMFSFNFDAFIKSPSCPQSVTYTAFELGKSSLPKFITFDALKRQFEIYSKDNTFAMTYYLVVRGRTSDPSNPLTYTSQEDLNITLEVTPNTNTEPPSFKIPLEDQIIIVNKQKTYKLPSVIDPDGDNYLIGVQLGQQSTWIEYKQGILVMRPTSINVGEHSIEILLTDTNQNPLSTTYYLKIKVISENEASSQTIVKTGFSPTLAAKLKSFDNTGCLTIQFTNDIFVPANLSTIDDNVLRLRIRPSNQSRIEDLTFKWEVTKFEPRQMTIQIYFTNPQLVSSQGTDMLQLIFMLNGKFIEQNSNKPIAHEFTLFIGIPSGKQHSSDENEALQGFLVFVSIFLKLIMIGNLVLNIAMQIIQFLMRLQVNFFEICVGNNQCNLGYITCTFTQSKLPKQCQDALCKVYFSFLI
eukprot:403340988